MSSKTPAQWRVILAFIFDLITSFVVFGYIIAFITGDITDEGFVLQGRPALIVIVLVITYFSLMPIFAGGRIWQHIFRATPR
jgi:Kef-type K+ transport system membrane component KefB